MGKKRKSQKNEFESDSFDDFDYYDDYDDDFDLTSSDIRKLSKDFYSTDWEDPSGSDRKFSTRRKIERRNDLKTLFSQFDDYDDIDLGNDWY
jgi:hypothetical protein